ncbi:MAG TPA: response regulator transcription factor [Dyella sp.]|uniref:response regulator transcription factor n=1 Tax=Dyella sp. TaxID=1869338 RepID=UPI002BC05DEE|nr:response regulator transcription factor [Dyella sp.]HUB89722.1 response regulator transcription factor [Dyella sp.]
MHRVALVEDHERLAGMIKAALSRSGIETDIFPAAAAALFALERYEFALLLLDRGLPDGDGIKLLRRLRASGSTMPCLMLTARDAIHDRVEGLESGADDYLTKPFSMEELVARVRSLMRRPSAMATLTPDFSGLSVDPERAHMQCKGEWVSLSPSELQIMLRMVSAGGKVVRHAQLEHAAWGLHDEVTPNALDVALHRLRKKLFAIDAGIRIVNVRGIGYQLQKTSVES